MILIIASEFDPHVDSVIYALKELGENNYIRLDFETAFEKFLFGIEITDGEVPYWFIKSKINEDCFVDINNLGSIWWRRSSAFYKTDHLTLPSSDTVDNVETYWMLRYLIESINESYFPFGHPFQMRIAENKIKQLIAAKECGFLVPNTILTNEINMINKMFIDKGNLVVKPIKSSIIFNETTQEEFSLKTSLIKSEELNKKIALAKQFSLLSQKAIKKTADIRVTVLNKVIIACKIDTSTLPDSEVDWRPNTFDFNHEIIQLPKELEFKIFDFMEIMGIRSGYFDFGYDADGEIWFIECNPNAQWLWIELKTGYKISVEIAKQLINQATAEISDTKHDIRFQLRKDWSFS